MWVNIPVPWILWVLKETFTHRTDFNRVLFCLSNQGTAQEMEGSLSCELCMQGTYQNQNLGDKQTCWVGCSTEPALIMFIAKKTHQNVNYKLLETIKSPSQFG